MILDKLSHLNLGGQIEDIQPTAIGLGASCDVFTGYWRAGSKKVAVKKLRIFLTKEDQAIKVRVGARIYTIGCSCVIELIVCMYRNWPERCTFGRGLSIRTCCRC